MLGSSILQEDVPDLFQHVQGLADEVDQRPEDSCADEDGDEAQGLIGVHFASLGLMVNQKIPMTTMMMIETLKSGPFRP